MDKETVRQIATRYADEVKKELSPVSIILFGSHVSGKPHEWSDIDIAVVMNGFEGDWLETSSLLFRLRRNINIDIEPHLMDEQHDRSGFLEHVKETGEVIYAA
jgi:predicted nucleotidyltransferase